VIPTDFLRALVAAVYEVPEESIKLFSSLTQTVLSLDEISIGADVKMHPPEEDDNEVPSWLYIKFSELDRDLKSDSEDEDPNSDGEALADPEAWFLVNPTLNRCGIRGSQRRRNDARLSQIVDVFYHTISAGK